MKKYSFFVAFLVVAAIAFVGCKGEDAAKSTTEEKAAQPAKKACTYSYDNSSTTVGWEAYKTTEKIAVGGKFMAFDVATATSDANSAEELLQNLKFKIDVKSVNTTVADRDKKIVEHFFGTFTEMENIVGNILKISGDKAKVSLSMNGQTHEIDMKFNVSPENFVSLKGSIDVMKWSGMPAIEALNKICYELHKGKDGVSKLWSEVGLHITSKLKENC